MTPIALTPRAPDTLLKRTTSRCPHCQAPCPGEVWRTQGSPAKVFLRRQCPTHGEISQCIASDARFYWLAKGDPSNACGAGCACSADPNGISGTLGRNANATVPDFLASGDWRPRPSVATLASAMDVGNPSNMERLRALFPELETMRGALSAVRPVCQTYHLPISNTAAAMMVLEQAA